MKISYSWLNRTYFKNTLPPAEKVAELLTMHSFEVESIEKQNEDSIFDIKVLPNRAHDCLSYRGIAKEVGRITGTSPTFPLYVPKSIGNFKTSDYISLNVDDTALVPRAIKKLARNVTVKESPEWLKSYLASVGQKSINNIVDASNFVMLETGQPVHTFDFDLISGVGRKQINIRYAKEGETITGLDDKQYNLPPDALVIADETRALDIAGIKGGKDSGINPATKNVLLSACNFDSVLIRKTSRNLGLRTDASVRFENGITPEFGSEAIAMLATLIEDLSGGETSADIVESYPRQENQYRIGFSEDDIKKILGIKITEKEISKILDKAGFSWKFLEPQKELFKLASTFVGVPYKFGASRRFDAPRAFDCSSYTSVLLALVGFSIPRISIDQYVYGEPISKKSLQVGDLLFFYSNADHARFESVEYMPGTKVPEGIDHVGMYLGDDTITHASGKFNKVVIEPFTKSSVYKHFVGARRIITDKKKRFVVTIPHERLDLRLLEDLVEEIARLYGYEKLKPVKLNSSRKKPQQNKKLYYEELVRGILIQNGFSELRTYSFVDANNGGVEIANPIASDKSFLRKNLRHLIEKGIDLNVRNLDLLGLQNIRIFEIGTVFSSLDDEYTSLAIAFYDSKKKTEDELKNVLGVVSKKLGTDVFARGKLMGNVFECNFDELISKLPTPKSKTSIKVERKEISYTPYSLYPYVVRDIAVFVPSKIKPQKVLDVIKNNAGPLAQNFKLFDEFTKKFPDGKQKTSYAYRIVFQSDERTLTDQEVNEFMKKISEKLSKLPGWMVR